LTLHTGPTYSDRAVSLRLPDVEAVRSASKSVDVAGQVEKWLSRAAEREDVYYFSVYRGEELVGQILLHDIDEESGEALVGYHLFQPRWRGLGIGRRALALLQIFVVESLRLTRLVVITSSDNVASRKIARMCGFAHVGAPREDPTGVLMQWDVPR
jgi:RimJ/RimL family protein N-acetyltransferase